MADVISYQRVDAVGEQDAHRSIRRIALWTGVALGAVDAADILLNLIHAWVTRHDWLPLNPHPTYLKVAVVAYVWRLVSATVMAIAGLRLLAKDRRAIVFTWATISFVCALSIVHVLNWVSDLLMARDNPPINALVRGVMSWVHSLTQLPLECLLPVTILFVLYVTPREDEAVGPLQSVPDLERNFAWFVRAMLTISICLGVLKAISVWPAVARYFDSTYLHLPLQEVTPDIVDLVACSMLAFAAVACLMNAKWARKFLVAALIGEITIALGWRMVEVVQNLHLVYQGLSGILLMVDLVTSTILGALLPGLLLAIFMRPSVRRAMARPAN